jgi:hypothetical protein
MQDNANPNPNERPALPLKGYSLMDFKTDPGIVGIAFETEQGPFMFVANKDILATLGAAFSHKAASMPAQDQG